MIAIVAADVNFGIGKDNSLLARLPADMKRFRALTVGNTVIMGRKTYESIPNRPLADRETLLLTRHPEKYPEVRAFSEVDELLEYTKTLENDVYLCGGGEVYAQLISYCEKALVTKVYGKFEVDAWFPNLDQDPNWELINATEKIETNGYTIKFIDYINNNILR